jgi:MinD-like ATPase involved in chromosome partitioning or flagellar assembly
VLVGDSGSEALVFVGARGGAGATSAAALAAASIASEFDVVLAPAVVLCDFDPYSAGADFALGVEVQPGFRWHDLASRAQPLEPALLIDALPKVAGFEVLAWGQAELDQVRAHAVSILTSLRDRSIQGKLPRARFVLDVARSEVERIVELLAGLEIKSRWFLVTETDVISVHSAARLRKVLSESSELMIRTNRVGGVSTRQVIEALAVPAGLAHPVDNDARFAKAFIRGEFASYCHARPKLLRQVARAVGASG